MNGEDELILNERDRAKLDGIVQQMTSNKESEENIRFVVNDFKTKYGKKSPAAGQPSSGASSVPGEPKPKAPIEGESGRGWEFSKYTKQPVSPEKQILEAQRGAAQQRDRGKVETMAEANLRYKKTQPIAEGPNKAKLAETRNKVEAITENFNREFKPTVHEMSDYLAHHDVTKDELKTKFKIVDDSMDEDIDRLLSREQEKIALNSDQTPYIKDHKSEIMDDGKGGQIEVDTDNFVEDHFSKKELEQYGINYKDFDGFLEATKKKAGFQDLLARGAFTTDNLGGSTSNAKLAYDMKRVSLIGDYLKDNIERDKNMADLYLSKLNGGNEAYKEKFNEAIQRINTKTQQFREYIKTNMPEYAKAEEEKVNKLKQSYKDYKEGQGDEFKNWGKGAWNGLVNGVHGFSATAFDLMGADNTAEGIRLQKEQEEMFQGVPDLYYAYAEGKKVNYKGTNYMVTKDGDVIDLDDKLKATEILEPQEYDNIKKAADESGKDDWSFSIGGTSQQASGVIGDMALQLLLTKGVGTARAATSGIVSTVGRSTALRSVENAIGRTALGKAGYSRLAAASLEGEALGAGGLFSKATKIPAIYGDILVAQSSYGFSNGFENTYKAMRDAGHGEKESKEIAAEAGKQLAALYGATAFIAPQAKLLEAIGKPSVNNLIKQGITALEKEGVEGFRQTMKTGAKGLLEKFTTGQAAKGATTVLGEGGKEVVQENIQQLGEQRVVNKNINEMIGEDLLKETYTYEDFVNTTALSMAAATMLNSPTLVRGTDKVNILSQLARNQENFVNNLDRYVEQGFTTREKAAELKKDVDTFRKYSNQIPPKTDNRVAFDVMKQLRQIDEMTTEMNNVHPALKDAYKERIETEKTKLQTLLNATETQLRNAEGYTPEAKETEADNGQTPKTEDQEVADILEGRAPSASQEAKAKTIADYNEKMDKAKSENPEQFWSVDKPSEEVLDDAIDNDRFVEAKGGMAVVKPDGDITGVFKYDNEAKGTGDALIQEAIEKGGTKLDNFDGYLTKIYERNGFKVVAKVPFNAEYAPPGWNEETHGRPDVVVMAYDPEGKITAETKTFQDYDEALKYRDQAMEQVVEQAPVAEQAPAAEVETTTTEATPTDFHSIDLSTDLGINQAQEFLDNLDKKLKKFGEQSLGINVPVVVARGAVKAMKAAVGTAKTTADLVSVGLNHVKESNWYKKLSDADKAKVDSKFYTNVIEKVMNKGKATKPVKQQVRQTTGQTDTSKKVETTEKVMMKLIYKAKEQAQRAQTAFQRGNRLQAVREIKDLLDNLTKSGSISPAVLKSALKGAANLDANNPKAVERYMNKLESLIGRINDKALLTDVRKAKRQARKMAKNNPANVRELGRDASKVNEKYLNSKDLAKYHKLLTKIVKAGVNVGRADQKMVDVDKAYDQLQKLLDKVEEARLQEIKDSLELLGIDPQDLGMSDSELKEFWDAQVDVDSTAPEDKKAEAIQKAEKVRKELQTLAEAYKATAKSYDTTGMSPKAKEIVKTLGQARLDYMSALDLKEYIKAIQNLETNDNLAGAGKVAAEIKAVNGVVDFVTKVIKSGIPLGNIKLRGKSGNPLNDLKSLSLYMKEVFKNPELMGDFNYYSGLNELSKGRTKVDNTIEDIHKRLEETFKEVEKENTQRHVDYRSAEETVFRGLVANLIQGDTKEEFETNMARIEDHIRKVEKMTARNRNLVPIEKLKEYHKYLKQFNSQEELLEDLKKNDNGNYKLIKFWMDEFAKIKQDLKDNTEMNHNEIFNEVSANYLPIKMNVDGSLNLEEGGSTYNYGGVSAPKQASTTLKRNQSKKLPANGTLDLDFDSAMANRMRTGLEDIHTAGAMQQVRGFFRNNAIANLMGTENTQAFVRRINYMQKLSQGVLGETSDVERAVSRMERVFKRIGVTAALGGVSAIVKQTIPVVTGLAMQVGAGNFGQFLSNFRAAQNNSLIEDYSTSRRGKSILGTRSITESAAELGKNKGYTGKLNKFSRKAGQFFDKSRNLFMSPLKIGDEMVAKAAWATYYLEYLKKQGYDVNQIDLRTEDKFIADDEVRQRAASYAETRVEETQVASDSSRGAALFNNPHIGVAALRSLFLPFQQFNLNTKMRMTLDISELMNKRKYGKLAEQVSNMTPEEMIQRALEGTLDMNNVHVTKEGVKAAHNKAWRSLGATVAEQIMFQGIKTFALTALTGNTAALFRFLLDDSDDTDDKHDEWMNKKTDWQFKMKQFYSNLSKDLNPLLVGNFFEDKQIDALNRLAYLADENDGEFKTYQQWAQQYKKDNGSLPWYRYDDKGKSVYGMYSIPVDIAGSIAEGADYAWDGEAYTMNDWGKEEHSVMQNKSQRNFMRAMFVMELLRATTGVEADSYRELNKIKKELIRNNKVSSKEE